MDLPVFEVDIDAVHNKRGRGRAGLGTSMATNDYRIAKTSNGYVLQRARKFTNDAGSWLMWDDVPTVDLTTEGDAE